MKQGFDFIILFISCEYLKDANVLSQGIKYWW